MKVTRRGFLSKIANYSKLSFAMSFAPLGLWITLFRENAEAQMLKHGLWKRRSVVGTLWMWGYNSDGQLGQNNINSYSSPVMLGNQRVWADVSAGFNHSLMLRTNGSLFAVGINWAGHLGDGTNISRSSPVQIGALTTWSKIKAGGDLEMLVPSPN